MQDISDEMLMAYADGELSAEDSRRVEKYLKDTPGAAARLETFVVTGRELGRLFDQPIREPVPQRILDIVYSAPLTSPLQKPNTFGSWIESLFPGRSVLQAAAAFSVVLACGGALGWTLQARQQAASTAFVEVKNGEMLATGDFQRVLETAASGAPVAVSHGAGRQQISPMMTFVSVDGNYCRQYDLALDPTSRFEGVACRMPAGQWRVEVHARAKPVSKKGGGIGTASGPSGAAIDAAYSKMSQGDALGAQDEMKLIARGWRGD